MQTLLVIGYVWPEPTSSAAGKRMMQLLEFFTSKNYHITFATTATESQYRENIEDLGVSTVKIELNNPSFDDFVKDLKPDVVLFDRFMMEEQFGWRVSKMCPHSIKILDTEDLHCLRSFREKSRKNYSGTLQNLDITKREIASIYRCDLSLIISEAELELLTTTFNIPDAILLYLPFLLEEITSEEIAELPDFESRKDFISIGNFLHAPNTDAVLFLKNEIWPLIRKQLPEAKMLIYGAYPSAKITQLHAPAENFFIKGRAADAAGVVKKARVNLAALRFGAGLKGKLAEAMQCGTPNVTTGIGAEGMKGKLPWPGIIEDSAEGFASGAIQLYNSRELWKQAQLKGFTIINSRFSKTIFEKRFYNKIADLRENLTLHRQENFTGSMLNHHRTRSTYYLSKYIELKNELERVRDGNRQ